MCNCCYPQMVVLALAMFVALSSCAVGCSGNTNSVSMSFVHWCYEARRQMEQYKKTHLLCNKSFPQMLFSTDRTVPSSCHTELVERIEHHDMFNINYFNLLFEKVFVSSFPVWTQTLARRRSTFVCATSCYFQGDAMSYYTIRATKLINKSVD